MDTAAAPNDRARRANDAARGWLVVAFAAVILIGFPIHELGHLIGFTLAGIPAAISLDHTYFTERWAPSLAGAAGGPIASVALAWVGALLVVRRGRIEPLGYALALVMPLTRLGAYAICAAVPRLIAVNDEGVMALDCGWPMWTWVWILLPLLVAPWAVAWRASRSSRLRKLAVFGATVAVWIGLALILEVGVIEPRLFPHAAARELVMPYPPR